MGYNIQPGERYGYWTTIERDNTKRKTRDQRWICRCRCGTEKSVLAKNLIYGYSISCGCSHKDREKAFVGMKIGKLTIIEIIHHLYGERYNSYKCQCECGNEIIIVGPSVYKTKSCGCSRRVEDITGSRFGRLVVKEMIHEANQDTKCKCVCDCGNEIITTYNSLSSGNTKSCGCIRMPNLIGKKFGKLSVLSRGAGRKNQRTWICKCDCGQLTELTTHQITSGHTMSCGCLRSESNSKYEIYIRKYLSVHKINYLAEHKFEDCIGIGGKHLRFDFYLPEYNTIIEYDGQQHFMPSEYFGGDESFARQKLNDQIKNEYCQKHNIALVRIPYTYTSKEVDTVLESIICNPVTTTVI